MEALGGECKGAEGEGAGRGSMELATKSEGGGEDRGQRRTNQAWRKRFMSALQRKLHSFDSSPRQHHPIHCRLPSHRSPVARRPLHHVLSIDRLPGRPESCAPRRPRPSPAPRSCGSRIRILPVPVGRGKGRQVRQQRLRRRYHYPRPRRKGRYAISAAARPDRGPAALCIPGTPLTVPRAMSSSTNTQCHSRAPTDDLRFALSANLSSSELSSPPTTPARTSSSRQSSSAMTSPTMSSSSER